MTPLCSRFRPLILLLVAFVLAACGEDDGAGKEDSTQPVRLVLDFAPNAVHAGTYLAQERGYDRAAGVTLAVRAPSSGADAIKLLRAGRADLAYVDIHDLAIADEKDRGALVGAMALVQRPLAALLAEPGVTRPRELEGRRAGVTGLPSDTAVLRSIVAGDGGDPDRVEQVTIGFQAVAAVSAGRVAAATGFWNVEGLALRERRPTAREFRVDGYGAPSYPELVLVARRETVERDRELVRDAIAALRRGYEAALDDPQAAIGALTAAAPGVDAGMAEKEFEAVAPAFLDDQGRFGALDGATLRDWAAWEQEFGIVERRPDVARLFAPQLAAER
jgi:ABC-type nitrate/sulfonate/bicarbonate transport system substrate-binding protein